MNLTGLVAAAFLDIHGRFAKDDADVVTVRLWFAQSPSWETDLTIAQFDALPSAERELIRGTGSGAGFVDTEHKSNA